MATIYAISDIHGHYEAMIDVLRLVDLETNKENKLIFLGDYVDGGKDSCRVLYHLKELEEKYPDQVIVLIGNHEKMFIDWYTTYNDKMQWLMFDMKLLTIKSFFTEERFMLIEERLEVRKGSYVEISKYMVQEIKKQHTQLLNWLTEKSKQKPYYETENQIYVHAGICEADEGLWKQATEPDEFYWKYPAETGAFYKDIIAGHVATAEIAKDDNYLGKVFWDGQSHFYIDGETKRSNTIPLLKYDTCTKVYVSYEKQDAGLWSECVIIKR